MPSTTRCTGTTTAADSTMNTHACRKKTPKVSRNSSVTSRGRASWIRNGPGQLAVGIGHTRDAFLDLVGWHG